MWTKYIVQQRNMYFWFPFEAIYFTHLLKCILEKIRICIVFLLNCSESGIFLLIFILCRWNIQDTCPVETFVSSLLVRLYLTTDDFLVQMSGYLESDWCHLVKMNQLLSWLNSRLYLVQCGLLVSSGNPCKESHLEFGARIFNLQTYAGDTMNSLPRFSYRSSNHAM